ncbi:MAG: DNA alkylation repair protein [Planctomycetota bacterium]|nr:DNA alkylation repair protein [Planctomycetota bacterium]
MINSTANNNTKAMLQFVQSEFKQLANRDNAAAMAAYMKTSMPFYGIPKPLHVPIYRTLRKEFAPASQDEYERRVLALWKLPHREEKYAAIEYARVHRSFIVPESLPVYEKLIRTGAWWDLVDPVAIDLVGAVHLKWRSETRPLMERWIDDTDMWIRRTAILSQNKHRTATDEKLLFEFCLKCAAERKFFIRKAIGWALRDYSYTAPNAVRKFLLKNRSRLSPLSFREGAKALVRNGEMRI